MKLTTKPETNNPLEEVAFSNPVYAEAYRELANQGQLVNITNWVQPEMGFSVQGVRIRAMLTAELWRLLVSISPWARRWQTTRGRGHDVLWLASYALHQARIAGRQASTFQAFLPSDDEEEGLRTLRIEYSTTESGRPVILIGLAEQLALL